MLWWETRVDPKACALCDGQERERRRVRVPSGQIRPEEGTRPQRGMKAAEAVAEVEVVKAIATSRSLERLVCNSTLLACLWDDENASSVPFGMTIMYPGCCADPCF